MKLSQSHKTYAVERQSPVVRRFIAVGYHFQRPMNRATTAGAPSRIP